MSAGPLLTLPAFDSFQRDLRAGAAGEAPFVAYLHKAELHWNGVAVYSRTDIVRALQARFELAALRCEDCLVLGSLDGAGDGLVYWRARVSADESQPVLHQSLATLRSGRIVAERLFTGDCRAPLTGSTLPRLAVTATDFTGQRPPYETTVPTCTNAPLLRAWCAAWNRGSATALTALYADVPQIEQADGPLQDGAAALAARYRRFWQALPGGRLHAREVLEHGDSLVLAWSYRGRHLGQGLDFEPSGVQLALEGISEFQLADGRIAAERTIAADTRLATQAATARRHPLG